MDGKVTGLIGLSIGLVILIYIVANTFPSALGTIANSTSGNAMKNVDTGTKSLYQLIPLFAVIAVVVGIVLGALKLGGKF